MRAGGCAPVHVGHACEDALRGIAQSRAPGSIGRLTAGCAMSSSPARGVGPSRRRVAVRRAGLDRENVRRHPLTHDEQLFKLKICR
jgi:hypothetical protein